MNRYWFYMKSYPEFPAWIIGIFYVAISQTHRYMIVSNMPFTVVLILNGTCLYTIPFHSMFQ